MVEVYRARGEAEALVIQTKLEDAGIPSMIKSNAAPSAFVFTVDGLGMYRVMVWEDCAAEARAAIEEGTAGEATDS